jgi:DnaJ-class molecular chaperone
MADEEDRTQCPPCRGTGRLISNLGGAPSEVACPWCHGTGTWDPAVDAQPQTSHPAPPAD